MVQAHIPTQMQELAALDVIARSLSSTTDWTLFCSQINQVCFGNVQMSAEMFSFLPHILWPWSLLILKLWLLFPNTLAAQHSIVLRVMLSFFQGWFCVWKPFSCRDFFFTCLGILLVWLRYSFYLSDFLKNLEDLVLERKDISFEQCNPKQNWSLSIHPH